VSNLAFLHLNLVLRGRKTNQLGAVGAGKPVNILAPMKPGTGTSQAGFTGSTPRYRDINQARVAHPG
jgi:hypothetical protein